MINRAVKALLANLQKSKIQRHHLIYAFLIATLLLISSVYLFNISPYSANGNSYQYFRADVVAVNNADSPTTGAEQIIKAQLLDGPQRNHSVEVTRSINFGDSAAKRLPIGSEVLLSKDSANGNQYLFIDRWYMPGIATLFIILLVLVVVIGAWRGITSVFGLAISITVLATFVVPKIVEGQNAFLISIEGAILITIVSVFVAHGFTKRAAIACVGSLLTLLAVIGLTVFASGITGTSEIIDENSAALLSAAHPIDIAGLLTGGIIIASLGTLFDITTGQAATVDEIHKTNRRLAPSRLFWKGMSVGREHVAALINTLALVYVGVALPSIITTIVLNQQANYHVPMFVNLNTEVIAEEVVRTSVASIGLLLAMPITTWLAAYILPRWTPAIDKRIKGWFKKLYPRRVTG